MKYIEIAVPDDFDHRTRSLADAVAVAKVSTEASTVSRKRLTRVLEDFRKDLKAAHGVSMDSDDIDEEALDWPDLAETYKLAVRALNDNDAQAPVTNAVTPVFVREDGQAFAIEATEGRFRSIVPADLGNEVYSHLHDTFKDAHDYLINLLRTQPKVCIHHALVVQQANREGASAGIDLYRTPEGADDAMEIEKRTFATKEAPEWNLYRFDVAASSSLSYNEVQDLVGDNLARYLDERATKAVSKFRSRTVDDSPSP